MEDWLQTNPMGGAADDRMFVKLKELGGGETPLVVVNIMYTLYKKNKKGLQAYRLQEVRHTDTAQRDLYQQ